MKLGNRQVIYIMGAFILLVLLQAFGEIVNQELKSQMFARYLNAGALVTNITGVFVGLYNVYQGLMYRKVHRIWMLFFFLGTSCIFLNVLALTK